MHSIQQQLDNLQAKIDQAVERSGRNPQAVTLLAVSKTRTAQEIRAVAAWGLRNFGENYLQEALPKMAHLADMGLVWHFIGALQSNKTRDICQHFHWLHTLDRIKVAKRLSAQRLELHPRSPLNVCIQINIDREPQKAGIPPEQLPDFLEEVIGLKGIKLRGLMAIPKPVVDPHHRRQTFRALSDLFEQVIPMAGSDWDTLSMGMSADFVEAILEGATLIRLGTAIFGPRPSQARQSPCADVH